MIHGDGAITRDFCHVADIVQANLLAATTRERSALGEVFNVGLGAQTTLDELYAHARRARRRAHRRARDVPSPTVRRVRATSAIPARTSARSRARSASARRRISKPRSMKRCAGLPRSSRVRLSAVKASRCDGCARNSRCPFSAPRAKFRRFPYVRPLARPQNRRPRAAHPARLLRSNRPPNASPPPASTPAKRSPNAREIGDAWIPGVEIFPRRDLSAAAPRLLRRIRARRAKACSGRSASGRSNGPPRASSPARPKASTFTRRTSPPAPTPEAWFRRLFIDEPANYALRPYDREQWDAMFFLQGNVEMILVDERAGLPRRRHAFPHRRRRPARPEQRWRSSSRPASPTPCAPKVRAT